jgi:hypothetical protein
MRALGASLAIYAVAGCGDFLSGPSVSDDPNVITELTRPGPLYLTIQRYGAQHEVNAVQYMQQIAGVSGLWAQVDAYNAVLNDYEGIHELIDIRKVQQLARKLGDSLFIGIAKVYEARRMSDMAATWGDVPYREAADSNNPRPRFDPQLQVYADLQAQLDSAITVFLPAAGPTNVGGSADGSELIYAGRNPAALRAVYSAVARSFKARLFLHVAAASRAGVRGAPPAAYDSALKYAVSGIASPDDDFLWYFNTTVFEENPWWRRNGPGIIGPGAAIVEILNRRIAEGVEDDGRISFYFMPAEGGVYHGFRPTGRIVPAAAGVYDGSGPYATLGAFLDQRLSDGSFRTPEITYAEMQLIAAEAAWQIGCPGCPPTTVVPAAQPYLVNARRGRRFGATNDGPVHFGDAPGTLPASLTNIIEEKYVTLFLNPEVWNDWKRTCLPSLAPALGAATIPGRLPYGSSELRANPNVPTVSSTGVTITSVSRNPNQPEACPALDYVSSNPLAN